MVSCILTFTFQIVSSFIQFWQYNFIGNRMNLGLRFCIIADWLKLMSRWRWVWNVTVRYILRCGSIWFIFWLVCLVVILQCALEIGFLFSENSGKINARISFIGCYYMNSSVIYLSGILYYGKFHIIIELEVIWSQG